MGEHFLQREAALAGVAAGTELVEIGTGGRAMQILDGGAQIRQVADGSRSAGQPVRQRGQPAVERLV